MFKIPYICSCKTTTMLTTVMTTKKKKTNNQCLLFTPRRFELKVKRQKVIVSLNAFKRTSEATSIKNRHHQHQHLSNVVDLLRSLVFICLFFANIADAFTNQSIQHVVVKRQSLQRFLVEPDDVTLTIGQSVTLPCKVSNKAGILQWTRDGFGLGTDPKLDGFPTYSMVQNEAQGDYSLKISSVTLEDDAIFQCQIGASENVPGIRSQSAKLTVQVPPEPPVIVHSDFINAPNWAASNQQVLSTTAGSKIELICEAYGARPAAELAWLNGKNRVVKKGIETTITPMNDGKRSNAALKWTFEPTKADHGKKLYCRATHPAMVNTTAASITLEVKFAPEVKLEVSRVASRVGISSISSSSSTTANTITTTTSTSISSINTAHHILLPNSVHGRVGDSLKIKCHADGNPGRDSFVYQWYKDSQLISDGKSELIIENVDKNWNNVEVRCHVTNSVGVGKSQVKLNIAYGPEFSNEMQYVYGASSGETVRLSCPVESNPISEITWIRVGSSSVILNTGSKLIIKNMGIDNVGEYLCRASVKGFPEISAIVYLRLNGPPKIRKNRNSGTVSVNHAVIGEPGHVYCLAESVPPPIAITWIHNGQVFTSNSANNLPKGISIYEQTVDVEPVFTKASFDIRITEQQHYGYYNCVVINKYGSDWHVIELSEQTSFGTIASITLISIAILLVIVLLTVIVVLSSKHRQLIKEQKIQKDLQKVSENQLKNAYLDDSDNVNLYSTTASTRTNSSSEKDKQRCDGSPRSSSSSFVPYLHDTTDPMNGLAGTGLDSFSSHHHQQPSNLSAGYHFHTVFNPDCPSPFYNPYSMSESPYHFTSMPSQMHGHRNHFATSHVSMSEQAAVAAAAAAAAASTTHQFPQMTPTHMSALQNGCEGMPYSSMTMKAFELPSNDTIYQANLYHVSPKSTQIDPIRASPVKSDQSTSHVRTGHYSPSSQHSENNNGLHV